MSQKYNKKLIEVAIPLEAIDATSAREQFIFAVATITGGFAYQPHYLLGSLLEREPSLLETATQVDLRRLLERAEGPR